MNYDEDALNDVNFSDVWDDDGNVYGCVYENENGKLIFEKYPDE